MTFDKSTVQFPSRREVTFLSHCGISPLFHAGAERAVELIREQARCGSATFTDYYLEELTGVKAAAGELLRTAPENVAVVKNTSEALSMLANGYPFEPGDEVISYCREYPANHYPWRLQERRGVKLKLLSNVPARDDIDPELPGGWSFDELRQLITPRTRVVAISHVQFTSGYAADLPRLGELCRDRGIDLVVDAAQSLGSMPVYPEEWHIAAIASAGWKWLLGPFGTGLFYTRPDFRDKLSTVQVGAETMRQGFDFTNLDWNPHDTARRFEYSSSPVSLVAALGVALREVHVRYGPEAIFAEILRLQDLFLDQLRNPAVKPLLFPTPHRSGILSMYCPDPERIQATLEAAGLILTARGGFLRVAPHFYNSEEDMTRLADVLNDAAPVAG